jgi:putative ABC transport system substrate-binding protein
LGIALIGVSPQEVNDAQLRGTFADMAQQQLDAAVVGFEGNFTAHRALIVELAEKYRLPLMCPYRDYVELGGLMAYAPDLGELAQRMAEDVHQILTGAKPGDIPFYQPTKFVLVINLKTAEALGLTFPQSIFVRADEVIE